jgi:hypothetical protein
MRTTLRVFSGVLFGLWVIVTLIVLLFVFDRWMNPGRKSISDVDLIHYRQISIPILLISGGLFQISSMIKRDAK